MSLAFPLLMFLPGYFTASLFTENEAVLLLSSLLGVALGFIISALYFRFTKKKYLPVVTEKKEEE